MHYVHPTVVQKSTRAWLFQATEEYDLVKELKRRKNDVWTVGRNGNNLRPGHIAILWQSGIKAGIYGYGELISRARDEQGELCVDIRYGNVLDQPILKSELRQHPMLKALGVIAMPRGRNPFRIRDNEWIALTELSSELRRLESSAGG